MQLIVQCVVPPAREEGWYSFIPKLKHGVRKIGWLRHHKSPLRLPQGGEYGIDR